MKRPSISRNIIWKKVLNILFEFLQQVFLSFILFSSISINWWIGIKSDIYLNDCKKNKTEQLNSFLQCSCSNRSIFPIDLFNSCILSQAVQMALWNTAFSLLIKWLEVTQTSSILAGRNHWKKFECCFRTLEAGFLIIHKLFIQQQ